MTRDHVHSPSTGCADIVEKARFYVISCDANAEQVLGECTWSRWPTVSR